MCQGDGRIQKGLVIGLVFGGLGGMAATCLLRNRRSQPALPGSRVDYVAGYLSGVNSRYSSSVRDVQTVKDPQAYAMGKLDGKSATPPAYHDERAERAWNEAMRRPALWETATRPVADSTPPPAAADPVRLDRQAAR